MATGSTIWHTLQPTWHSCFWFLWHMVFIGFNIKWSGDYTSNPRSATILLYDHGQITFFVWSSISYFVKEGGKTNGLPRSLLALTLHDPSFHEFRYEVKKYQEVEKWSLEGSQGLQLGITILSFPASAQTSYVLLKHPKMIKNGDCNTKEALSSVKLHFMSLKSMQRLKYAKSGPRSLKEIIISVLKALWVNSHTFAHTSPLKERLFCSN